LLECAFKRLAWMPSVLEPPDLQGQTQCTLELAERYADGEATFQELRAFRSAMKGFSFAIADDEELRAYRSLGWWEQAVNSLRTAPHFIGGPRWDDVHTGMSGVLRCLFHPFHTGRRVTPLTPAIFAVACGAYEQRCPGKGWLDPARFSVLADAMEEAGCTDEHILSHLRSPGPHVRGCWALDLILGKE
jgi:hypothetical protein